MNPTTPRTGRRTLARLAAAALAALSLGAVATPAHALPINISPPPPVPTGPAVKPIDPSLFLGNPSFETPAVPSNSSQSTSGTLGTCRAALAPGGIPNGCWTVREGSVDVVGAGVWQAADGAQSLHLTASTTRYLKQAVRVMPNTRYTLSYRVSVNPTRPGSADAIGTISERSSNGRQVKLFAHQFAPLSNTGRTRTAMRYETRTVRFTTQASTHHLIVSFFSPVQGQSGGADIGSVLDDVNLYADPMIAPF